MYLKAPYHLQIHRNLWNLRSVLRLQIYLLRFSIHIIVCNKEVEQHTYVWISCLFAYLQLDQSYHQVDASKSHLWP